MGTAPKDPVVEKLQQALKLLGQAESTLYARKKAGGGGAGPGGIVFEGGLGGGGLDQQQPLDPAAVARAFNDVTASRRHVVSALGYLSGPKKSPGGIGG